MKVVILAGGPGSRMGNLTERTPKPLLEVAGKPILFHTLGLLAEQNLRDVLILTSWKTIEIETMVGDGSRFGLHVEYHRDPGTFRVGTAGAVASARALLGPSPFLLIYGDLVLDVPLGKLQAELRRNSADAIILTHPNNHPHDSDLVDVDDDNRVNAIYGARKRGQNIDLPCRNLALSAISAMSPRILNVLEQLPLTQPVDFGKQILPLALRYGYRIFALPSGDYCKDVGTPERLREASNDLLNGRVSRKTPRSAVFLDRDGVINAVDDQIHPGKFVNDPDQFRLFPNTVEAIRLIRHAGHRVIVVTNQGGLELGYLTPSQLQRIHVRMDSLLAAGGTYVDRVYHCPHFRTPCQCRKPRTGLIQQAARDFGLDLSKSFFVGDRTSDLECARRACLRSFLVRTGSAGQDGEYNSEPTEGTYENLFQVARALSSKERKAA